MPILNHGVQEALRQAGILPSEREENSSIQDQLNSEGLSTRDLLIHLKDLVDGADTSAVKLRAIDTGLKLHGVLKDQAPAPPSINIIINDKDGMPGSVNGLNPILIPRKASVESIDRKTA